MSGDKARFRWMREPVLQFLAIGAAIFLVYRAVPGTSFSAATDIVVTSSRIATLEQDFARTWLRAPTPEELNGLIEDYLGEEIFYREALAMGLDRDDIVVRRRMRQKMEFLSDDLTHLQAPTDDQLRQFLTARHAQYATPASASFEQIFIDPDKHGADTRKDAVRLLDRVQHDGTRPPIELSDRTILPPAMDAATVPDIAAVFGDGFAEALLHSPVDTWIGPLKSSYGLHLVRVTSRQSPQQRSLDEIRSKLTREWQTEQAHARAEALYRKLRAKYHVKIEYEEKNK